MPRGRKPEHWGQDTGLRLPPARRDCKTSVGLRRADVGVIGGHIVAVESYSDPADARVIDIGRLLIISGSVEAQVHSIRGETLASAYQAAAIGGVTMVL